MYTYIYIYIYKYGTFNLSSYTLPDLGVLQAIAPPVSTRQGGSAPQAAGTAIPVAGMPAWKQQDPHN